MSWPPTPCQICDDGKKEPDAKKYAMDGVYCALCDRPVNYKPDIDIDNVKRDLIEDEEDR